MPDILNTAFRIDAAQQTGHVDASLPQAAQTNFVTKIRFDGEGDTSPCRSISDHPPTQTTLNDLNANLLARLKDCIEDGNKTLVSFSSPRGMKNCQFLLGNQEHSSVPETQKPSLLHECLKQLALNQSESGSGKPIALGDGYSLLDFIPSEESIPSSIDSIQGKLILRNASGNQVSVDVLEMAPPFDGHSIKSAHLRECHNLLEQHASYLGKDSSQTQFGSANGIGRSASLLVLNRFKQLASADQVSDSFETVDDIIKEARAIRGEKFVHTPEQERQLRIACVAIQAAHLAAKQASRTSLRDAPKVTENSPKDLAPSSKKTPETIRFPDLLEGSSAASTQPKNSQSKESLFPDLLEGSSATNTPLRATPKQSPTVSIRTTGLTPEIILQKARQAQPPRISIKHTMVPVMRQRPAAVTPNPPIVVTPPTNAKVPPAGLHVTTQSITTVTADAIVNAANPDLRPGGGVCGAIYKAAGQDTLNQATKKAHPQGAQPGDAKIVSGKFGELSCKHVIHAVGPNCNDPSQNKNRHALLSSAYRNAMMVADKAGCQNMAFPAISTGIYGFPTDEARQIAIKTVSDTLKICENLKSVTFSFIESDEANAYQSAIKELQNATTEANKATAQAEEELDDDNLSVTSSVRTDGTTESIGSGSQAKSTQPAAQPAEANHAATTPQVATSVATAQQTYWDYSSPARILRAQTGKGITFNGQTYKTVSHFNAVSELEEGEKKNHWIWYVFPQLSFSGLTDFSKQFALKDLNEAKQYLKHPKLKPNLEGAAATLVSDKNKSRNIRNIMGSDIDVVKLHASMTLFSRASDDNKKPDDKKSVFHEVLKVHFGSEEHDGTLRKLGMDTRAES